MALFQTKVMEHCKEVAVLCVYTFVFFSCLNKDIIFLRTFTSTTIYTSTFTSITTTTTSTITTAITTTTTSVYQVKLNMLLNIDHGRGWFGSTSVTSSDGGNNLLQPVYIQGNDPRNEC